MKITIDIVNNLFKKENYTLLSNEYINAHTKLNYKCSNGHIENISYNNFKNGRRCPKCKISERKIGINYIRNYLKNEGYILLDSEYKNTKSKLNIKCPNGHLEKITFDTFKRNVRCNKCSSNKLTYDFVKYEFEKNGYILLETDYINNRTKMNFKCPKGHLGKITYNNFKKHKCSKCFGNSKHDIEYIKKEFQKYDYTLLENNYINSITKMNFKCPNGHYNYITYKTFKRGSRCSSCLYKNEQKCRKILENYFKNKFPKTRPNFLNGLELDGYNQELNLAFEYNGEQHYIYNKFFHNNNKLNFFNQRKRDLEKFLLCKINNIKLIIIPYYYNNQDIISYISHKRFSAS